MPNHPVDLYAFINDCLMQPPNEHYDSNHRIINISVKKSMILSNPSNSLHIIPQTLLIMNETFILIPALTKAVVERLIVSFLIQAFLVPDVVPLTLGQSLLFQVLI